LSQLCFKSNAPGQGAVIYYDGMELDEMGRVLSPLKPFQRKRVNRTETAEFHADITESGFKDMFKVLHATCAEEERHEPLGVEAHKAVRYAHHANVWKALVARTAWVYGSYNWSTKRSTYVKRTAKETWDVIMHNCKSGMYEIVTTDVTVV
jgi:hypothetical protein